MLENDAVLRELQDLRATGVAIGVSASGPSQPETIDRAVALGCFDAVQATWNLHERAAGPALARAHDAGMAVIVKEALANGRLTPRVPNPALERAANELGATVDAVALAAVLAQPWVESCSAAWPRARRSPATSRRPTCDCRRRSAALGALEEDSEEYWSTRSDLPWN